MEDIQLFKSGSRFQGAFFLFLSGLTEKFNFTYNIQLLSAILTEIQLLSEIFNWNSNLDQYLIENFTRGQLFIYIDKQFIE